MGDIFDEVAEEYKKQYKGDIFDEVAEQYTPKEPPFEARHPNLYALGKTAIEVPKLIGKRLGAGALEGLAEINKILPYLPPFWPLLMPEMHKKYKEYTVTPALRWAEKLRKGARGEGKLDEGLLSFIEGMGTMIPTLPADIMAGGATKATLVPRIIEKAAKILAKIPDFVIGMGIRGFAGGIEEGKPLKAIQQAIENTGFGLIYSKLQAGRLKDLPKWLAVGIAEPTYQATKQGRLPTPEELISGLGTNTGYFLLFSSLPILKQNIKDAVERKAIEKYEKKLQKTEDPEKEIEELFKDPAISEQTKKSLEQLVDESNKVLASTPAQTQLPLKPSAPAPESSVELLRQLYEEAGLLRQGKKLFPEMQKPEEKPEIKPEPITSETPKKPATQDIFDEVEKEMETEQKLEVEKAKKEAKPELETLTEEEKQILRDRGFTESQIDRLLPEEGRKLIDEGLSPEEVSILRDGKVKVIKKELAAEALKDYPDLTEKHKKPKIRFDLLPDGWKMVVGKTRTKEGHSAEAEVDWPNKQIVFSKKEFMDNPDIANHEIAHVIIESSLPENKRKQLYNAYVNAKKTEWEKQGADPDWIVKNKFHHEAIAIDLGQYLTDPAKVNPDVAKVFRQFLTPENIFGKAEKEIKSEQKGKKEVAIKQPWQMTKDEFESDNMLGEKPHVLYHLSEAEIKGKITKGFATDSPMRAFINMPYAEKGVMYAIRYDPDKIKKSGAHTYNIKKPVEIIAIVPKEYWRNPHRYFVKQALEENKPVPPEVLKDYPDLAEKHKTQPESKKEKIWLTDEPFTKDEVDFFNEFSHFSVDINKEFKNIIQKKENAVKNKLKEYGLQEIPPDLKRALEQYRKVLHDFFLAKAKARSIAPPISVVGKAKYKGNIKRAEAIEEKANKQLKRAEAKIDNILSKLTSGIAPTQKRTQIHYSELKGSKIKKALNADFATKRYHNKHKDGSGSIGFTIGKGDKTYNLTASYDKNGYLYDISFGVYPDVGKPIDSKTYDDLIKNLKKIIEPEKTKITTIKGNTASAYLPDGKKIDFAYKVVDADDLISSHQYDGTPNTEYPKELQPRMRERKASIEQIVTIANNLIPEKLGENPNVSDGAPIVGKDFIVESGNGRVAAIRLAYDRGKANHYKQWLIENAKRFGLNPKEIAKIEKPVLVRERITDVDRKEFVKKANEATTARMSPLEQAKADADRLTDADIDLLDIPENGNIFARQNRDFVKTFLAKLPKEEASQYYTSKGDYTKQLADRITFALFYKAYGDDYLASLQAEEANPEIKNILNALIANSKDFIKAKTLDTTGQAEKVVKAIVDAVREYKKTKDLGITVEHHLAQQQLFTELPEHVGELMKAIDRNKKSSKKLANMLKYIAEATKQQAERFTNQQLFGDKPLSSEELVYEGLKRHEKLGAGGEHGQPRLLERTTKKSGKIRRGKGEGVEEEGIEYEAVTKPEEVRESLKFKPEQLTLQFTEPAKKAQIPTKQRVVLRTTGYIKAQGYVVRNADDTASLLSPLRKKAQEEVYFVIADKDGRVLEILRYSKGTKKSSEMEPSEIAGRIFSIPNAKKVYFIHNHPAVSHQPSASDVRVYTKLKDIFVLGGIDTEGLVISGKHYTTFNEVKFSEPQEIKPAVRKVKIPVKERFIVRESSFWKATSIQTPERALKAIKGYQNKDGFLILNTKNRDIGFYVYDPNKSAQENFVNLAKLIEATNANAVIFNTKKLTPEQASLYELITSRGFIPVYDVIENGESLQAKGELDAKITQARLANPVEENIIHYTAGSVANTAKEILKFAKDSKIDIDPEDLGLLRLYSDIPSWLRNESPEFKKVFDVVDERWRNFNTIRNTYLKELFDAWKSLSKKEKERVGKILYKGDELRKELSDKALAKLTPNERRAYKATREVLNFIWNEELPMLMEELGVPKTEIEQYRREVGNVTGYMPHPRKGAYYIFVKDPKTKEILYHTMFDDLIATLTGGKYSPKGAKLKKILREQFGADKIIKIGKHTEQFPEEAYFEVSPLVTQELINVAMEKVEGSEKLKQTFKQAIEQAIADVFKVRGFMKHGIKRKGVPGYEVENWQDAVIEYINGWAGYKSKLLAAKKLNEIWGKIDWGQKHNLRAYAEKYVKDTFANQTQFDRAVDKFRAFLFFKYLGGVLKSAALQLTQNFVTTIPRLTVETNWAGSKLTAEMMRSGMDLIKALYTKPAEGMSRRETAMTKRLTEEELRALARARLDGTISDQLTEEVMGMMPGKYGSLPREFAKALRWMFGVAEIFNRETTFLTAFRIARKEKGMNFEDAYKFASKIIDETHFRYGKFNLPPFARGGKLAKVARSAYTFRSFTHNILHLYKSLASDYGWRGKWGLAKSFMAILALGGIKGLPFASTINWVYRKVTGSDLFQDIAEIAGDWYKAVLYGAPSFLGIDLTGSISIEMPRTLKELVGVPYDIGSGLAKTYQDIQTRDFWRAVENFPLFLNVMRYPLQAYRLTTRGIETRHGKRVVDSDFKPLKLTTGEGLLKAVGFQPITLSEAYRKAETSRAIREVWKEKKDTLVSAWAKAMNRGDEETAKGLLEQMMEYNKKVVEKVPPDVARGLFITNETLWKRMQPKRLRALERR